MIFLEGRDHFIVLRCPNMEFCYNFSMYGLFPVSFSALKQTWYRPTFASILEKRTESWALVGVGFLQIGLHLLSGVGVSIQTIVWNPLSGLRINLCNRTVFAWAIQPVLAYACFCPHLFRGFFIDGVGGLATEKWLCCGSQSCCAFRKQNRSYCLVISGFDVLLVWAIVGFRLTH
jgi:hypothetical protein